MRTRHAHQEPPDRIGLHRRQHHPMQVIKTVHHLLANRKDRADHPFENIISFDQLAHTLMESPRIDLAHFQAEGFEPRR